MVGAKYLALHQLFRFINDCGQGSSDSSEMQILHREMSHVLIIPQFCLRKQLLSFPLVYLLGLLLSSGGGFMRATGLGPAWRPSH